MRRLTLAIAICGALACAPGALADSIVYEKDGNVWEARPDGSGQRQITTAGGFAKPTQADDGTIVAVKDKLLQRMDRAGRILNTAGDPGGSGPITPQLSPNGLLVAYSYNNTGVSNPGLHVALSHSTRQTGHDEIYQISGRVNPAWIANERVLMFDGSPATTGDTLIKTLGGGFADPWYEDPELSLSGGEISSNTTRFAATDGVKIRLYALSGPPPATPDPRCDLTGPNGSFFRPSWSPDGGSLAWQEDDGIWAGAIGLDPCSSNARLLVPGGKAPDWGPANVSTSGPAPGPSPDTAAPSLRTRVASRASKRQLLRGLTVKVTCNEPCVATAELLLDRRTAKRLRLAAAPVRIGRATKRLTKAGTASLRLRPTAKARKRLARGRVKVVSVRVRARDGAGNRSKSVTKRVRIR